MFFVRTAERPKTPGRAFEPPPDAIKILVGGDVCFDQVSPDAKARRLVHRVKNTTLAQRLRSALLRRMHKRLPGGDRLLRRVQLIDLAAEDIRLVRRTQGSGGSSSTGAAMAHAAEKQELSNDGGDPFAFLTPLFRANDLVMLNLETPLADGTARRLGMMRSDPRYAQIIAEAGVAMVNLANNHIYDAGDEGLRQTICSLREVSIAYAGYGENLETARRGTIVEVRGLKIAVLGYTQYCNNGFSSVADEHPGILPMDRELVLEDIRNARSRADVVLVNVHWGVEDQPYVQARCVDLAHQFVAAGADAIIGHHPHVPHGIEIIRGKPVIYSLGNLVFGTTEEDWTDNILVQIVIHDGALVGLIIYPVTGKGADVFQPRVPKGERATAVLTDLQLKSSVFGTAIAIRDGVGYISMADPAKAIE